MAMCWLLKLGTHAKARNVTYSRHSRVPTAAVVITTAEQNNEQQQRMQNQHREQLERPKMQVNLGGAGMHPAGCVGECPCPWRSKKPGGGEAAAGSCSGNA